MAEKNTIFSIYMQLGMLLVAVFVLSLNFKTLKENKNSPSSILLYFSIAIAISEAAYNYAFIDLDERLLMTSFIIKSISICQLTFIFLIIVLQEFEYNKYLSKNNLFIISVPLLLALSLFIIGSINGNTVAFNIEAREAYVRGMGFFFFIVVFAYRYFALGILINECKKQKNGGAKYTEALVYLLTSVASLLIGTTQISLVGPYNSSYSITILPLYFINIYKYIEHNGDIEKKNVLVQKELDTARDIQISMLPNIEGFVSDNVFDIYALMDPAKEVGGDFYDFYNIDENHVGLCIADVSDKGVPAALFMSKCITLLKNTTLLLKDPSEVLKRINNILVNEAKNNMFITVWLGILDKTTGILTCANAGHEFPMLKIKDHDFYLYDDVRSLVIGMFDNIEYKNYQIKLNRGDTILVYTDGLPEAFNDKKEMFKIEEAINALNKKGSDNPKDMVEGLYNDVKDYVGKATQYDDITMLCLKYNGEQCYGQQ